MKILYYAYLRANETVLCYSYTLMIVSMSLLLDVSVSNYAKALSHCERKCVFR